MVRRDYILRAIEQFIQALARVQMLKQEQQWQPASEALEAGTKLLIALSPEEILQLSDVDLLARLVEEGPAQTVAEKTLLLVAMLKEAGDLAAVKSGIAGSQPYYLKALELLLDALARQEVFECPAYVPQIDVLLGLLESGNLPPRALAGLMHHYERIGNLEKAEDTLFALMDAQPGHAGILEFGKAFYRRLLARSDQSLAEANLPRTEVEQGLRDLEQRAGSIQ